MVAATVKVPVALKFWARVSVAVFATVTLYQFIPLVAKVQLPCMFKVELVTVTVPEVYVIVPVL